MNRFSSFFRPRVCWAVVFSGVLSVGFAAAPVLDGDPPPPRGEVVAISVDPEKAIGPLPHFWAGAGDDPLYYDTHNRAGREALKMLAASGIRYLRYHNLFTDGKGWVRTGCRVYREDERGRPVYRWTDLDETLDFLAGCGFRLILETSFMPDALADLTRKDSEGKGPYRNYGGGWHTPPKDYGKWRDLVYNTVRHCRERYGPEVVRSWYWEVWNEPDVWWHYWIEGPRRGKWRKADLAEFCKLYDYFVDGATAADPKIKVGGPAAAGFMDFFGGFVEHCLRGKNYVTGRTGTRADFFSFHYYGPVSRFSTGRTNPLKSLDYALRKLPERTAILRRYELQINEWGPTSTTDKKNRVNNTAYLAAFLCRWVDALLALRDQGRLRVDQLCYWGTCNYSGFNHRAGLTVKQGDYVFKRPILNAFAMLARLGRRRLGWEGSSEGDRVHGWATRSRGGGLAIVVYHFDERDELSTGPARGVFLKVRVSGEAPWRLRHFRIDAEHSNAYTEWIRQGRPARPSPEQARAIRARQDLELLEPERIVHPRKGWIGVRFAMPVNSVSLLLFEPTVHR